MKRLLPSLTIIGITCFLSSCFYPDKEEKCPAFNESLSSFLVYNEGDALVFENDSQERVVMVVTSVYKDPATTVKCKVNCSCYVKGMTTIESSTEGFYKSVSKITVKDRNEYENIDYEVSYNFLGLSLNSIVKQGNKDEVYSIGGRYGQVKQHFDTITIHSKIYQDIYLIEVDTVGYHDLYLDHNMNAPWQVYYGPKAGFVGFSDRYSSSPYMLLP